MLFQFVVVAAAAAVSGADIVPFEKWHHQRIDTSDVQLHVRWQGSGPPLMLVHGFPQHSLTWHTIGPLLAQNYTVICPDNRGMGASTIPTSRDYTAKTVAEDLKVIFDFFGIEEAYVVGHDKGAPPATALAYADPGLVRRLVIAEMMLPAFGLEQMGNPQPGWDTNSNWHLAWFVVPEIAAYFSYGRVKELLTWYIWHTSYSGISVLSHDDLESYTRELSKPGFLEAGLGYFKSLWEDVDYFNATVRQTPLAQPILVLGGEANFAPAESLHEYFDPLGTDLQVDVIPHAGHWIGDENPEWTAARVQQFLSEGQTEIASVDLSSFLNRVTLQGAE